MPNSSTDIFQNALTRTTRQSRYVQHSLTAEPTLTDELKAHYQEPFSAEEMTDFLATTHITDEATLFKALRRLRKRVMVRTCFRDLNGFADLAEVTTAMTALAEITLNTAASHQHRWLSEIYGEPIGHETGEPQELLIVGMGKLGGVELNVSSDIDLIFVYPEQGDTTGPRKVGNHEFFTKLGQRIIASLHDVTADGFVFRVDMRLRPYGDSGSLVVSFAMLENYLITQARAWERYAWIKARTVYGSRAEELVQLSRPFIFRKYLDYGALADLRKLHSQIREEAQRRDASSNIKIGSGGIREIEFIAQVFQLIRGGRERTLQIKPTLEVLAMLDERGLLPGRAVVELMTAYHFLRNLEHRLQYLDDAQTQRLPDKPEDQQIIAEAMNFADYESFLTVLNRHREIVLSHFECVLAADESDSNSPAARLWQSPPPEDEAVKVLADLGYDDATAAHRRLTAMRADNHYLRLPERNRARLDSLVPRVIETAARMDAADVTLHRMLDILEAIDRREAYLALLTEHPPILGRIARLASVSAWAADYLRRHPILLDELLDTDSLLAPPHWRKLAKSLRADLDDCDDDIERQMDFLRHFKQAQLFRLLAQDLEGLMTVERLSDHLTELADHILDEALRLCWQRVAGKDAPPPRVAIAGYGKLGGKELGYASDLDIVFIFDDEAETQKDQFARLTQRVISWLNTLTPAGVLYETDLRLRPDGEAGLLVTSISAFREYQEKHAWVWEHQALTRARYCVGDPGVGEAFEDIRLDILTASRDIGVLRKEVIAMREKMRASKKLPADSFDVKHGRGGIVDIEFIVQFLVLAHSHRYWELTRNLGTIALLRIAADLKLIPRDLGYEAADAYRECRRLQHRARLNDQRHTRINPQLATELTKAPMALWDVILGAA
ncbi:MAG: bifunctional [glutamate--ammonia ligase]-adenylyl-L-tyrosine phosphorylase/[glutamate--ammonia-ligase] adenylyltransferase [Pseudomonadota bacterium]